MKDIANNLYRLPRSHLLTSESAALLWLGLGIHFALWYTGIGTRGPTTRHLLLPMPSAILQIYMLVMSATCTVSLVFSLELRFYVSF